MMTKHYLYATINSKHYISVSDTTLQVFTGAHYFEEGRPLRIILQRTWKFSML